MRAIVQRVSSASVLVEGKVVGSCGNGLLVLVAARKGDLPDSTKKMADRVLGLRIFNDVSGKMNLNLADASFEDKGILAISNFTLYGETAKNRRPSFVDAAPYDEGENLFNMFVDALKAGTIPVQTGEFGADMKVNMVNDGPVTVILET